MTRRIAVLAVLAMLGLYGATVASRASLRAPAPTPLLTDRQGGFLAQLGHRQAGGRVEYGFWQTGPLPDRVVRATLALEDRRFWSHRGVDPLAVLRAAWQDLTGLRIRSGASTIAMQVARLQDPSPRTPWAKLLEAGTALALTARHGREAVLAQYLRLVPYANGSHGIGHAARFYLDKPVADLSWAEIAFLAAIPQAPALHNPLRPDGLARAKARGQQALALLAARGAMPSAELETAQAQLAALVLPAAPRRPPALHLVERMRGLLDGAPLDPADPRVALRIDRTVQAMVEARAIAHLATVRPMGAQQVAAMVVRRADRQVVASIGSAGYADTTGGAFDFTRALRSPGSVLKPFLYAAALDHGVMAPGTIMGDLPDGAPGIANADHGFLGPILPRQALANSRNVPAADLLQRLGLERGFAALETLGLHDGTAPPEQYGLTLAIGGLPTSLERVMRAYGALADDGWLAELDWHAGQALAPRRRALGTEAARLVTLFLADPQARLPTFPRYGPTEFPFPVALKTGTSQGYRDAWMVAWSRDWIVGAWIGRPDAAPMEGLGGANAAGPLVQAILLRLHGSAPGVLVDGGFPPPEGHVPVALCARDGRPDDGRCTAVLTEWVAPASLPPPDAAQPIMLAAATVEAPRLVITSPAPRSRFWRNPELPPAMNRLPLRAATPAGVRQLVWYVDGLPFALATPGETVWWPMQPGTHRIGLGLPHEPASARVVRIVVE